MWLGDFIKEENKMKKFIALLLPVIMILSFVACGDPSKPASGETTLPVQSDIAETTPQGPPTFEMSDYKGRTFKIAWPILTLNQDYYLIHEETGDQLNDAVYNRLMKIEEQLNIKFAHRDTGELENCNHVLPLLQRLVGAGDAEFDMVLSHTAVDLGPIIYDNLVLDWNNVNYIDPTKEYWNHEINRTMSVMGKQPYISNSWNIAEFIAILFNKKMITDYQLDDPFGLVHNNKWTIDKMTEMAKIVVSDINGDGVFTDADQYGFGTSLDWHMKAFLVGFNQQVVAKNSEGLMEYVVMNERMITIAEKMYKLLYEDNTSLTWVYGTYQGGIIVPMFDEGRMLFLNQWMAHSEKYRQADVEYGILPHPKLDENQEKFRAYNSACYNVIPNVAGIDTDLVGKVLELLGYWGYYSVVPTYKEVLLTEKVSRDNESAEMLDIIFSNVVVDLANAFGYMEILYALMNAKSVDVVSWYDKNMPAHEKTLEKSNEAFAAFGK